MSAATPTPPPTPARDPSAELAEHALMMRGAETRAGAWTGSDHKSSNPAPSNTVTHDLARVREPAPLDLGWRAAQDPAPGDAKASDEAESWARTIVRAGLAAPTAVEFEFNAHIWPALWATRLAKVVNAAFGTEMDTTCTRLTAYTVRVSIRRAVADADANVDADADADADADPEVGIGAAHAAMREAKM